MGGQCARTKRQITTRVTLGSEWSIIDTDIQQTSFQTPVIRVLGLRPSLRLPKFVPVEFVKGELTADWRAANPELISAEAFLQRVKAQLGEARTIQLHLTDELAKAN